MIPEGNKGFVLVLALVTMLAMTIIGLSVVMNMTTDMQLSRNEGDAKMAFQLAEAGINEAIARLHLPSANNYNIEEPASGQPLHRDLTWSDSFGTGMGGFRNSADDLNYAVTIGYLGENNPEGKCDNNGVSPNNSGNALAPPPSCDQTPVEIVMFGRDFNMGTLTNINFGKFPVYSISSTGTSNGTSRTVVAYVGATSLNTDTEGAINTNSCIDIAGGSTTITGGVKEAGNGGCGTCNNAIAGCAVKAAPDQMSTYLGPDIADVIGFADEIHNCTNGTCSAAGDDIPSSGKIDDVVLDWGDYAGDTYSTMIYINNPGREVELSGNFTGRGILIVAGDLKLSGNLSYEGLIYVFGQLSIAGGGNNLNVQGGVMADSTVALNGNVNVSYDQGTLEAVAKENSTSSIILWKRL